MIIDSLLSDRSKSVEISGIRRVFELGRTLKDPINLSIGQPHFDVPKPIRDAAIAAIESRKNGYTVTQGIGELRDRLLSNVRAKYQHADRDLIVTSGTSGALMLAMFSVLDPGDEVVAADPYFVMYPNLVSLIGGGFVAVDTYPSFDIDPDRFIAACTPRTKIVLLVSPANPTGAICSTDAMERLAKFCESRNILLISDEIYRAFHYGSPARSPAEFGESVLVVEGFGKTYGITGWRLGFAHGPKRLIDEMMKLQQSTFICAPSIAQWGGLAACDFDVSPIIADYERKRNRLAAGLKGYYEFAADGGAFYLFPKCPWGSGFEFATEAAKHGLLVIPGGTFSKRDTHFRISYAASDETLDRGIAVLQRMAATHGASV